ncbi:HDIG domain-containing protein [Eubacteriales bacterium OttesenSCG-928-A19]|nr:HDIG domain-containing protein [Eubacteriales bacterium OttesenSCG-928-A19]
MKRKTAGRARISPLRIRKQQSVPTTIAIVAVCYALLTLGMIMATSPERYNLSVGDIATKTITATKDVVDEITTESRRERAAEAVLPSYKEDETAMTQVLEAFDGLFADFETIRAYGEGIRTGAIQSAEAESAAYSGTFMQADLEHAKSLCESMQLSNWQLTILMRQNAQDLNDLYTTTRDTVRKQMESTIREGQLETAIAAIQRQILPMTSSDLCLNIAMPAVRATLMPNMVVDQEATDAAREHARQEVEPTYYKSGQNIVVAGERVTEAQRAVLESLGLLEGNRFDVMMMTGVGLLSLLTVVALFFHIMEFDLALMTGIRNVLLLASIFLIMLSISVLISNVDPLLSPVAMVALLTTALLSPTLAITSNLLALMLVSVLTISTGQSFSQQMLYLVVSGALSAPVGIYVASRFRQQRISVLLAGISMAVVNFVAMISIGLLTNNELRTVLSKAVYTAGGSVLAAILCMGAQPILEWLFNLVTPFKLMELSNPNQPLLRRLLVETPGTYHHSIMVANLAEAAAEAVGADPLLTRVGSYYHDIGKLKRPLYFKENQMGDNPHDRTDPRVSAAIIIEHVTDGVRMAKDHRVPEQIADFIIQHHGDTTVSYFLHKMKSMEGGGDADPADFQYPGPKPQTVETAIVMLADTVEAAIRAGGDQPADVIESRIRQLVKEKIDMGQLDESPLRYADVEKIVHTFTQVLIGIYHKRIEYPQDPGGVMSLPKPPERLPEAR